MALFLTKSGFLVWLMALSTACFAQVSTGQVYMRQSNRRYFQISIRGATIRIEGAGTIVLATTDTNGIFILNNIQTGRYTLLITCTGYDAQVANEVLFKLRLRIGQLDQL